jgi:hypothetical protein
MQPAPPLSTEARVATRRLWREMAIAAERVTAAIEGLSPVTLEKAASRDPVVARRAVAFIRKRLPAQLVHQSGREAAWRFLFPEDEFTLVMMAVLLNTADRPVITTESFGVTFSHHCVGRHFDRAGPETDAVLSMHEAHGALLRLQQPEGDAMYELPTLMLPTQTVAGGFLSKPRRGDAERPPMARCWTWISRDMMFEDQDYVLARWRELLASRAA